MDIFISYSSKNRRLVEKLADDLQKMGHLVWFDREITGGHEWWSAILEKIRKCDLVILALTTRFFDSDPCRLEYEYALALNKRLLPVALSDINVRIIPSKLQKLQKVDYQHGNKPEVLLLVKSLNNLPVSKPLPQPLPDEPPVPVEPLTLLRDQLDSSSLNADSQRLIVSKLREFTENEETDLDAWDLLEQFAKREDLLSRVEKEISALLKQRPHTLEQRKRFALLEPRTILGHQSRVNSVMMSHDGKYILSGSDDFSVRLWDAVTGDELFNISHVSEVMSVAFSPDHTLILAACKDKKAYIYDIKSGRHIASFEGHKDAINSAAFSSNGQYILTGSDDKTAILWNAKTGVKIHTFGGHSGFVTSVTFSPNSNLAVTGSFDHTANIWDISNGEILHSFAEHNDWIRDVTISSDGLFIATGSRDKTVRVYDLTTYDLLSTLVGDKDGIFCLSFSPDGKQVATGSLGIKVRDTLTGNVVYYDDNILAFCISFTPNGRYLLVGDNYGIIHIIDPS